MRYFGATDPGRSRDNNEDAWAVDAALRVAVLADGMGGESCGEVASAITIESILEYLRAPEEGLSEEEMVREAIRAANRRVIERADGDGACSGMGSTVVVVRWEGSRAVIANVGDSRVYLFRGGELRQLSYDQNFANELRHSLGFSEERVRSMPNRNVLTMAIGTFDQVLIRLCVQELAEGDQLLLCSDGLHGPVSEEKIGRHLASHRNGQEKVEKLIAAANAAGGPDNVTAVLLECRKDGDG